MKTLTLTTALIATLAAPAFANSAADIFAAEAASQQELVLMGSSAGGADAATLILAEARSNDERTFAPVAVSEVISTQSIGGNAIAARIFAAQMAASAEGE